MPGAGTSEMHRGGIIPPEAKPAPCHLDRDVAAHVVNGEGTTTKLTTKPSRRLSIALRTENDQDQLTGSASESVLAHHAADIPPSHPSARLSPPGTAMRSSSTERKAILTIKARNRNRSIAEFLKTATIFGTNREASDIDIAPPTNVASAIHK